MELNKENIKKIHRIIIFTALVIVCLWKYEIVLKLVGFIFHIIYPFVLGGAIAFIVNVPMYYLEQHLFPEERKKKSKVARKAARPVSMILVLILMIGIITGVLFGLIPQLAGTVASLGENINAFLPKLEEWLETLFRDNKDMLAEIDKIKFDWDKIVNMGITFFKTGAVTMLGSTVGAVKTIIGGIADFFIAFAFSCYILLQKEKLSLQAKKICYAFLPEEHAKRLVDISKLTYRTFSNFITGQCVEAVILGSMFVITMSIFRIPYALLIGVIITFTALIPIFGAFIGCGVGTFLIFIVNPFKALVFLILFLVLQQVEGNLIYPHVVGGSVGLPSIWVLAAVSIGGSLMGVVGMLIFIPLVSVMYTLFKEYVHFRLKEKKIDLEKIK